MRPLLSLSLLVLASASGASSARLDAGDSVRYARLQEEAGAPGLTPPQIAEKLEASVLIYAQDGHIWWRLGQARLAGKRYDAAIDAYRKAIELGAFGNKFKAAALYDIACAYALKGDEERAFAALNESMRAGWRDLAHLRGDADLKPLHADRRWVEIAATKDVTKMSRHEAWRYDLWLLDREVQRIHFDPYCLYTKAEQDAWVRRLHRDIPRMTDNQIRTAFMKYMRRMGDGHTNIRPPLTDVKALPLQLYWFEEGIFVTLADPKIADLVGAQVLEVAGRPVAEVVGRLDEVIARDNAQGPRAIAPRYLTIPALLHGLGLMPDRDEVELTVRDAKGLRRTMTLRAEPPPPGATPGASGEGHWTPVRDISEKASPLYLKRRDLPYWFEHLPEMKAVYMQYNSVRNDPKENTEAFAKRLFEFIQTNDVQRLIVDVRWNGGGNSFLNLPLVNGIIGAAKVNKRGSLFVITGRGTFSAAQNFTTDLGRALAPIFVGEPTGSSPNFVGESVRLVLPYSKMQGSVSDLYWQRSWPMDHRNWIAPDLPAPPSFELFRANRDPAMEAIAAYLKG